MIHPLKTFTLATAALLAANAAQAASISYAYALQPGGTLDFSVDSAALNSQGYGTVDSSQGLQSWSLQIAGQTFTAPEDPFYPSEPNVTLVNSALSFAVFAPTNGAGVFYDFYASGSGTNGGFGYTFTGSDGTSLSGTAVAAPAAVPEPATLGLIVTAMLGTLALRRRRA